jgi:hypothetical protein
VPPVFRHRATRVGLTILGLIAAVAMALLLVGLYTWGINLEVH